MIYVTSDNHGRYKELASLLKTVNFSNDDELIIAGDLLDRFSDINGLINLLRKPNVTLVRGNHEELMLKAHRSFNLLSFFEEGKFEQQALKRLKVYNDYSMMQSIVNDNMDLYLWFYNGGLVTLSNISKEDLEYFIEYCEKSPYYVTRGNTLITHAGPGIGYMFKCENIDDVVKKLKCDDSDNGVLWDKQFYNIVYLHSSKRLEKLPCSVVFGHTGNVNEVMKIGENFIVNLNGLRNSSVNLFCIETQKLYKLTVTFDTTEV